jgi:hypothetical protein
MKKIINIFGLMKKINTFVFNLKSKYMKMLQFIKKLKIIRMILYVISISLFIFLLFLCEAHCSPLFIAIVIVLTAISLSFLKF